MSEYKKFKELTKPLKFRQIRRMWNTIRDVILNNYYNILYKLNIIDKVSNSDETSRQCATLKSESGHIVSNHVMCDVVVKVVEHLFYEESYYRTKKGKIIPIYYRETATVYFLGCLDNLAFNFTGYGYKYFNNPIIVYTHPDSGKPTPLDLETDLEPSEVVEVDISCVRDARIRIPFYGYYSDLSEEVISDNYSYCHSCLLSYVSNMDWEEHTTRSKKEV